MAEQRLDEVVREVSLKRVKAYRKERIGACTAATGTNPARQ